MKEVLRIMRGCKCMNLRNEFPFLKFFCETLITGNRRQWERLKIGKKFHSQDKNIVHSPLGEIKVPDMLFHDYIFQNWSLWERKVAVECVNTGKKYTYRDIRRHSRALAAAFQNRLNLSKGDTIALILPNCPEFPIAILAASRIGVIPTTVNPVYTVDEIRRQFEDSKIKLIITNPKTYHKCTMVSEAMKTVFPILVVQHKPDEEIPDGGINLIELFNTTISGDLRPVKVDLDDTLVLPYSSGTTGNPKGVLLSHRNVVSNLSQMSHPETALMAPTTRFYQEKVFVILPMFHIFGMMVSTFYSLKEGCRLIVLSSYDPKLFLKNMYFKKVSVIYVVPPLLLLLSKKEVSPKTFKSVKFLVNGGSPMPYDTANTILNKAEHVKVVQGYGLTETSPVLAHTSTRRMQKLTSIGIPIASTKLKIVNTETGQSLPKGERGELCAWGPQVMKGYLNRRESTEEVFDNQGWFKTGDIAYYDDDGDFFIVQRMKELIKVKGFQVAPHELEEVLRSHPKIFDAAVVGIPHPEYGEVPKGFIILEKSAQMTEEEVQEFLKKKVAHYKQLRGGVRFLNEFPRNKTGKVLRAELVKMP